jgi:hypothetical protein
MATPAKIFADYERFPVDCQTVGRRDKLYWLLNAVNGLQHVKTAL